MALSNPSICSGYWNPSQLSVSLHRKPWPSSVARPDCRLPVFTSFKQVLEKMFPLCNRWCLNIFLDMSKRFCESTQWPQPMEQWRKWPSACHQPNSTPALLRDLGQLRAPPEKLTARFVRVVILCKGNVVCLKNDPTKSKNKMFFKHVGISQQLSRPAPWWLPWWRLLQSLQEPWVALRFWRRFLETFPIEAARWQVSACSKSATANSTTP